MATRYQIAKLAGVSAATVTNVLNRTKNVSPEVREQVMNAAQQLDYSAAGLDVKYSEYAKVDHDSWNRAFAETELLEWMFSRSLPELARGDVTGNGSVDVLDLVRLKKGVGNPENTVIYGNADYDESGALDSGDLVVVRRILLGS